MWTVRQLFGLLVAGLSLLAFGAVLSNKREANEQGMYPIALALKGIGLGLITWALWRHVRANLI